MSESFYGSEIFLKPLSINPIDNLDYSSIGGYSTKPSVFNTSGNSNYSSNPLSLLNRQQDLLEKVYADQQGFGWNKFSNLMSGIGSLANAYVGLQGLSEAKRQGSFNRNLARTNLANQSAIVQQDLIDRAKAKAAGQGVAYDASSVPQLKGTM